MVLELAWILNADTREYFRIPVDVGVAVLAMLCQARVRPFRILRRFRTSRVANLETP